MAVVKDKTLSVTRTKGAEKAHEGRDYTPWRGTQFPDPSAQNPRPSWWPRWWPQVPPAEGKAMQKWFSPLSTEQESTTIEQRVPE